MIEAIVVVGALLVVPGAGASLALAAPGEISVESRIALAFGLGYGIVAGLSTLLALAHVFSRPTFIAGVLLVTIAVWTVALRRAPVRVHASALVAQARKAPFVLGAGLALVLAVALTRPFYPIESSVAIRSAWRYWADGLEVAAAGHVPTVAPQWGIEIPATVSKVVLNAFEGGVSYLLGPEPLPAMHGILTITAIGVAAALLALGRELGLGMAAPLVPVLIILVPDRLPLSHEISTDLGLFTAEGVGRLVAFCAALVGIYALRSQRWAPAIVTGALLAVAGLTHLVPTLIAGALLALFAVALVLVDHSRLRTAATRGALAAAVFGVSYGGTLGLSGGDLGLQRATSGASFTDFPPGVDPTRSFTHGKLVGFESTASGRFLISPREIVARYAEDTLDRPNYGKVGLALLALLGIATAVAVWFVRPLFIVSAVAWGLAGTIVAVALFFSFRYDTQIPANFGVRRLYDYVVIPPALLLPVIIEAIARPLARRRAIVFPTVALAAGALAVAAAVERVPEDRLLGRAEAGKKVFARFAEHVPCDARVLANARTAGIWEAWTGRLAVTEGMSPFLRPAVMGRILPILVGANDFFRDPQANRDYLEEQRIDYLVLVSPGIWFGWGSTGRNPKPDDAKRVAALPGVERVYQDERVAIFAVGQPGATSAVEQPERCPIPV